MFDIEIYEDKNGKSEIKEYTIVFAHTIVYSFLRFSLSSYSLNAQNYRWCKMYCYFFVKIYNKTMIWNGHFEDL